MIRLQTQRFGTVERPEEAVLRFQGGIFGFELCQDWLLLGDRAYGSLYWLQSLDESSLSLSVVDPREFLPEYVLKISASDRASLAQECIVLSILTQVGDKLALNLKNPIIIDPELRLGRQIVTADDQPIRYELSLQPAAIKQTA